MKLDIGCGARKRPGMVGVDRHPASSADVIADIEKSLPFRDSSVEEIWRVGKPGCRVEIRGPHFTGPVVWGDPTHRRDLSSATFVCFTPQGDWWYTKARFTIERCLLKRNMGDAPPPPTHWWNRFTLAFDALLEAAANRSFLWLQRAERTLGRLFGYDEIQAVLRVEKNRPG